MANGNGNTRVSDGQLSWSGGVDSNILPTFQTEALPDGLPKNMLSWAVNSTVRGSGVNQRPGFQPLVRNITWPGLFQGASMYEPEGADPYIIMDIGGRTYRVNVGTDNSVVEITIPGDPNNATLPQHWFRQGEQFLVIQDNSAQPLVWDGNQLRRINTMGGTPPYLPIGTAMDYFMGRMWVAQGRSYYGSDIVRGASGTALYSFRDSILHTTENAVMNGGGGFIVPTNAGVIRAIFHTAELDTALGQGRLYIGTRTSIYALNVPVNRDEWTAVTQNKIPLQTVAQIRFGTVGDRSVVQVNGDAFYQTLEPGIRSLTLAIRYFQQWANVQLSSPEQRVMQLNDRALLRFSTGILFDNRLLMSALPEQHDIGVVHKAIVPLDYDLISTLQEKHPPAWEGTWDGINILQLLEADFGGLQRAFAIVVSDVSNQIEVWEITRQDIRDNGDTRIQSYFETGGFFSQSPFDLKELESAELWFDNLQGTADINVEYRADGDCWHFWHKWRECSARNSLESDDADYPVQNYCPSYRAMRALPNPPVVCTPAMVRPSNLGYTFQLRITIRGSIRIRGIVLHAKPRDKQPFYGMTGVC